MAEIDRDWEVTVQDVNALRLANRPHLLLDVREPHEHAIGSISGARLIPLGELPQHVDQLRNLPSGAPLIAHCHHGMRSLRAAAFLRAAGIEGVMSMHGGIDAWSQHIDPSVPRY